ncbi:unnamed protein product [Arctogadus glacialis]
MTWTAGKWTLCVGLMSILLGSLERAETAAVITSSGNRTDNATAATKSPKTTQASRNVTSAAGTTITTLPEESPGITNATTKCTSTRPPNPPPTTKTGRCCTKTTPPSGSTSSLGSHDQLLPLVVSMVIGLMAN